MKTTLATAAATLAISTAAYAAPVDLTTMNLNGSAALDGSSIALTPASNGQNGSAFIDSAFAIDSSTTFSAAFELGFSDNGGGGADGIAFLIHNGPSGANQLGMTGGGIGYAGISPSLAIEFDTWDNGTIDNGSDNHVGIAVNGNTDSTVQADPGFTIQDQSSLFAWVDYDGTSLEVSVSTTNVKPGTVLISADGSLFNLLGSDAYFGFTASTGGANTKHQVNSFDLAVGSTVAAVPLPAGLPLLGLGMLALGGLGLRRKT